MDLKELEALIDLFERKGVAELEYEEEGRRIVLKKAVAPPVQAPQVVPMPAVQAPALQPVPAPVEAEPEAKKAIPSDDKLMSIESPIVGTFYRAPAPDAKPYVEEGDVVKKGQVLCIIEAMKLMNEIEAELEARIVSILVENAQPVEFGEPLFLTEPL
ncbi:MAG: acetyl-CoA carboxylase biotin carboxyl carrier protein [Candidatus Tectimicrobiota bacterium]